MSEYILEMHNISKSFAGVQALKDVSIRCKPGQVHGLVGENGAGKSTLMKILAGAYKADAGDIIYKGERRDGRCQPARSSTAGSASSTRNWRWSRRCRWPKTSSSGASRATRLVS